MKPLETLRAPKLFNPRADPFERSEQEADITTDGSLSTCSS
jgi:hypothetical protein